MRKSLHERLAAAELRQARATARVATIKVKAQKAEKKRDDRRKILVGAIVIVEMERDPKFAAHISTMLGKALTRPHDLEVMADLLKPGAEGAKLPASNANTPPAPAKAEITAPPSKSGSEPKPGTSGHTERPIGEVRATYPIQYHQKVVSG